MLGWSLNLIAFKPLEVPPLKTGVRFFSNLWMATELKLVANLVFYLTEHNWLHSSTCESKEFVNHFTQICHYFTTVELLFKVFYKKKKIKFAQCCFRAYLLMFQNDWKDLTPVQRRFWGTNCELGVNLSRRNNSQFSFFSLYTERIKERWLLSESVLCLQRGDWETIYLNKRVTWSKMAGTQL